MKCKGILAAAIALLTLAILFYLFAPREPQMHATFPETLSQAQRREIPSLVRKESQRRMFAFLKSGQFRAVWGELRSARTHKIIAIAYKSADTNKVWVYLGRSSKDNARLEVSTIYPMTNTHGHWKITDQ